MRKHLILTLAATACLMAGTASAEVSNRLLAYLVVRNPAETSATIGELSQSIGLPIPNLMPMVAAAGLGRGIDQNGEWLFALSQGNDWLNDTAPMLIAPVLDYAEFASAVGADPSGDVCNIKLLGEEVLVAERNKHAVFMNAEHRSQLTHFVRYKGSIRKQTPRVEEALSDCGAVLVLTRTGLLTMLQPRPVGGPAGMEDGGYVASIHKALWPHLEGLELLTLPLKLKAQAVAVGLRLEVPEDGQPTPLRLKWAADFPGNASPAEGEPNRTDWTKQFPDEPLVAAAGGPVTPIGAEWFVQSMLAMERRDAAESGFAQFGADEWKLIEQCYRDLSTGVRHASLVLRNPGEDEPLFAALAARLKTDDSAAYLEQIRSYCEAAQEINDKADTDIRLKYNIQERPFSDDQGLTVEVDLQQGTGDETNDVWQLWLQKFLGADGKLRVYFGPNGNEEVVVALQSELILDHLIEGADEGAALVDDELSAKTLALMDQTEGWSALVSPSGYAAILQRLLEILSGGWGAAPKMPTFAECPPVGITTSVSDGVWSGELVAPIETLRATRSFVTATGLAQPR